MQFYEPTANDDATIESVIKQPGKQVMFLQADWCGDCKAIKPFVQQFKDAVTDGGANWVDADRDANLAIAQEQGLMGFQHLSCLKTANKLPTLVTVNV